MSQTHTCPVCGRHGLPPNCGSCPQCDADLTCFQALDSLSDPAAAKTAAALLPKRRFPWVAIAIIVTAVLLLLAGLSVSMKSRLSELDHQLAELKAAEQRAAMKKKHEESLSSAPENKNVVEPVLPPESKIHIDAQVRILDERETETVAAKQELVGENHEQTSSKNTEENAVPVVAKEKSERALVPDELPVDQKKTVEAENEATKLVKVVREEVLPDTAEVELLGSKMPPPVPVEKTTEQAVPLAPAEEKSANPAEVEAAVVVAEPQALAVAQAIPSENNAELAVLPETPPVVLTPKYRKHRVKSIAMETVGTPAAEQVQNFAPIQRGGTFSYLVKDGENAWDIAERFYGNRKYYPVVMEQNPHIFLGFIRKGSSVRLFTDRREAAAFYQRKIEQREGLILWKYQVRSDETWRSIYARFFLPRYSSMIFYGNQEVIPGKTVKIILR
ncbi:MAG: hypothetical protein CDV28_12910 [Candidatus Electronema aureum]|uniref:LysM domain-containing protein n=1 Tax=Candidatus Electronema aureum TaxID=2005002 RepID=A0A521G028_9BACT|nr:MAG: hypothetical protein CDV28_12910 [Candidatus Electronema aureum]